MALLRLTPMLRTPSTFFHQVARLHNIERTKIGKRGVVDYTNLGMYSYVDHAAFPMPAVRRKDNSPEVMALRDREKGDWKKLSIEDKKALYRASFCQTYAEMRAHARCNRITRWFLFSIKCFFGTYFGLMILMKW